MERLLTHERRIREFEGKINVRNVNLLIHRMSPSRLVIAGKTNKDDLLKRGITSSAVSQNFGKLCFDFREGLDAMKTACFRLGEL